MSEETKRPEEEAQAVPETEEAAQTPETAEEAVPQAGESKEKEKEKSRKKKEKGVTTHWNWRSSSWKPRRTSSSA